MISSTAERLLRVWEENQRRHPVRRGLALLAEICPEASCDDWCARAVGARDRRLLELHEHLFGGELRTVTACPKCSEQLESDFEAGQLSSVQPERNEEALRMEHRGYVIDYRLPSSADLLEVIERAEPAGDRASALLERCVSDVLCGEQRIEPRSLPSEVRSQLEATMAELDPLADVRIALQCPACEHRWELGFDIVTYVWSELDDWAQRTLAHVHVLASAYGWSEAAILALSPTRRQLYLDMVSA
jgi:hypothetical protein